MIKELVDTYNINVETLKHIFPEYADVINDAVFSRKNATQENQEKIDELEMDFVSSLDTNRISEYILQHPESTKQSEEISENDFMEILEEDEITEEKPATTDEDKIYFENFRLDTLQKLVTLLTYPKPDVITDLKILVDGEDTKDTVQINDESIKYLIDQAIIDRDSLHYTSFGYKILELYTKCFPLDSHPFSFVYDDVFPNVIMDTQIRNGVYVNLDVPFLYNGSNLFIKANLSGGLNARNNMLEDMMKAGIQKADFKSCKPSAYCMKLDVEEVVNIQGGKLGYVIFYSDDTEIYVDSLTFNYVRNKYGDLEYFYDTNKEKTIIQCKNGKNIVAYIISEKTAPITTEVHGEIATKIKEKFETNYISYKEFRLKEIVEVTPVKTTYEDYKILIEGLRTTGGHDDLIADIKVLAELKFGLDSPVQQYKLGGAVGDVVYTNEVTGDYEPAKIFQRDNIDGVTWIAAKTKSGHIVQGNISKFSEKTA